MKQYTVFYVLFLMVGLAVVPAHATLLTPGSTVVPGSISTGSSNSVTSGFFPNNCDPRATNLNPAVTGINGTLVADTCVLQRSDFPSHLVGDIREVVFKESGTGTLDFFFQFQVISASSSANQLANMWVDPFNGFTMNVNNVIDASVLGGTGSGANDAAISVRSGGGATGSTFCNNAGNGCIVWSYGPGVASPGETVTFEISTNATGFTTGGHMGFDVTNGGGMDGIQAFVPTAVPEPVSIVLLGTTLAFVAFFVRRRQAAKNDISVS